MKEWQRTVEGCSIIYMMVTPKLPIPTMIDANSFLELLETVIDNDGVFQPIPITTDILNKTGFQKSDKGYVLDRPTHTRLLRINNEYYLSIAGVERDYKIKWFHDIQYYMRKYVSTSDSVWFLKKRVFPNNLMTYNIT